jgi:hypothetical protein
MRGSGILLAGPVIEKTEDNPKAGYIQIILYSILTHSKYGLQLDYFV